MADKFNILNYTAGPIQKTGQTTEYTPAGRTTKDDGGFQRGIIASKQNGQYIILTTGQFSGTTNITVNGKTDIHSNECVFDQITNLMWSRTVSASVFGTGAQDLFWSAAGATGEDIFNYCDAANTAGLAGFSDWRIPNIYELFCLLNNEQPTGLPNSVAFPSITVGTIWTSTTQPNNTANGKAIPLLNGNVLGAAKTTTRNITMLCRLGVVSSL